MGQKKPPRLNPQIERESWRLLASLERLDAGQRVKLGDELVDRLRRDVRNRSLLWALGRFGARVPFYGPLNSIVPPQAAVRWLDRLLRAPRRPTARQRWCRLQRGRTIPHETFPTRSASVSPTRSTEPRSREKFCDRSGKSFRRVRSISRKPWASRYQRALCWIAEDPEAGRRCSVDGSMTCFGGSSRARSRDANHQPRQGLPGHHHRQRSLWRNGCVEPYAEGHRRPRARCRAEVRSQQILDARPPLGGARASGARRSAAGLLSRHEGTTRTSRSRIVSSTSTACGATAARRTSGAV